MHQQPLTDTLLPTYLYAFMHPHRCAQRENRESAKGAHPSIARPGTGVTCEFLLRGAGPASGPSWWGTVAAWVAWGSTPQVALQTRELGAPGSGCRMSVLVPGTNLLGSLYTRSQGQG
jgi:hypothetical protein